MFSSSATHYCLFPSDQTVVHDVVILTHLNELLRHKPRQMAGRILRGVGRPIAGKKFRHGVRADKICFMIAAIQ
jgi:hypothetical protein